MNDGEFDAPELFQAFMSHSPVVAFMKDEQGRYVYVNQCWEDLFSLKIEEIQGKTDFDWMDGETARQFQENDRMVLASGRAVELLETIPLPNGELSFWTVLKFPFTNANGQKFIGSAAIDVTERKEAEEKLRQSEREIKTLVENSPDIIVRFDKNLRHVFVNRALEKITGVPIQDFIGKTMAEVGLTDEFHQTFEENLREVIRTGKENLFELQLSVLHGSRYFQSRFTPEFAADKTVESVLVISRDTTGRKELEERLRSLTLTDDLTNLYNRRGFLMLAERQLKIARSRPTEKNNYLIFADMDGLKQINDGFGHDNGSLAITKMSEILADNFRGSDIIARLGGDEFVVLLVNTNENSTDIILNRLQTKISGYNEQKNHPFNLSLSVGITPIDLSETATIEELLVRADQLMYEQKRQKKGLV